MAISTVTCITHNTILIARVNKRDAYVADATKALESSRFIVSLLRPCDWLAEEWDEIFVHPGEGGFEALFFVDAADLGFDAGGGAEGEA